ncbi:MAG: ATP-binding protein [Actinomycetota bacterium]|nr:ATP-binding protein [Actinomycetota bacterium]
MRPLDALRSLKMKLGVVILAAVGVTVLAHTLGLRADLPLALIGAGSGVLALAVVQVLARGMTAPLREMADAALAMARGDYSRRVTETSRDEVGDLARSFNRMAAELAEADRMRRDLVANVSHELRTPIGALQAVLENLVDGVEAPEPDTLRAMQRQAERLGRLVTQLLDLSRLESGAVPVERRAFAVRPVIAQAVEEAGMTGANVRLVVEVDPPELAAHGDPERIHQVVANLLDNAVRHSPPGGEVRVAASNGSAGVRIEVADQGPGIPEHEATRVFERFYRTDAARSSGEGGTGLGLAIARWVVELHGGEIAVRANEPAGCRMVVTLPRAAR